MRNPQRPQINTPESSALPARAEPPHAALLDRCAWMRFGLAQVFGFAKQSGGGVRIATRVGEGTSVKVFLPRAEVIPTRSANGTD